MGKDHGFEVVAGLASGVTTVTVAVPAAAVSAAVIVAVNCLSETNVVGRLDPFHCTTESFSTKFAPFTVSVNSGSPSVSNVGLVPFTSGWEGASVVGFRPNTWLQPTNRRSAITANRRTGARSTNGSIVIARFSSGAGPVPHGRSVSFCFFRQHLAP